MAQRWLNTWHNKLTQSPPKPLRSGGRAPLHHALDYAQIVIEARRHAVLFFCAIVPFAQAQRVFRVGLLQEYLSLFLTEDAALQFQAPHRIGGKLAKISIVDGT